ncbi:MAG: hypothetical protein PVI40_00530 [Chlamydiota bacterium]|jgi:hypothetical protein
MLEFELHPNPKKHIYSKFSNPRRKTAYLFALCANHPFYLKHKEKLIGVLDMLEGLEYHIKKIRTYEKAGCRRMADINLLRNNRDPVNFPRLSKKTNHHNAKHETVAYIGRLGQLYYFFSSDWFGEFIKKSDIALKIPSILALMPLRNKHVAHRQQDYLGKGDCDSLGLNEYGLQHCLSGKTNDPELINIEYSFPTKQRHFLLKKYHPLPVHHIEYLGENHNLITFTPTTLHQTLTNEAIDLLELFFNFKTQASPNA